MNLWQKTNKFKKDSRSKLLLPYLDIVQIAGLIDMTAMFY